MFQKYFIFSDLGVKRTLGIHNYNIVPETPVLLQVSVVLKFINEKKLYNLLSIANSSVVLRIYTFFLFEAFTVLLKYFSKSVYIFNLILKRIWRNDDLKF